MQFQTENKIKTQSPDSKALWDVCAIAPVYGQILLGLIASMTVAFSSVARADDFEVLKQKKCTLLITPASSLNVGDTVEAETSNGKRITFRVAKTKNRNATVVVSGKGGRCPKITGTISTAGSGPGGNKKLFFGIIGNAGLFTFKQPFEPTIEVVSEDPNAEPPSQPQPINGLSGIGFSAGGLLRFVPKSPFGIDLGMTYLSASTSGKTQLLTNEEYVASAKFSEVAVLPGLVLTKCISAKLMCKVGGVFAFPLGASISIKSTSQDLTSPLKYSRMGGEVAAGFNLGKAFTLVGGTQISIIKGSFQFPEQDMVTLDNPATVYIFGGFLAAF